MKSIKFLAFVILVICFFFLEIAISFSFKNIEETISFEDNVSFALNLENSDSEFESSEQVDLLVNSFIKKNNIHGASVAVTYNDSLVYAKGFGIANDFTDDSTKPGHLFRIASISKLITAVAILKLFEDGQLSLDDHVFGRDGILCENKYLHFKDPRIEKITVSHLLNHTGGWSDSDDDPLFNTLSLARKMKIKGPLSADALIEYSLNQKLKFSPGSRYSYSNLGYVVLGKIIEKKSLMSYEDFVNISILSPLGIKDMHIGKNLYHEKYPNEVMYFEPPVSTEPMAFDGSGRMVPMPYGGNNISLLGAAGGWIASAPELIKFVCAIDGHNGIPDILSSKTIQMMTDPVSSGKGRYGWRGTDNHGTWWRTGTLAGSAALIVRQGNSINWIVLLNSSLKDQKSIHRKISGTMFTATYQIKSWPHIDLFTQENRHSRISSGPTQSFNPGL